MPRRPLVALGLIGLSACATDVSLPPLADCVIQPDTVDALTHDMDRPAGGAFRDSVHVDLTVRWGRWAPEATDGPRLFSPVFVENGEAPTVPGPLIRGRAGTALGTTVCNALPDTVWIAGLDGEGRDSIPVPPGSRASFRTILAGAGTRLYEGLVREDSTLAGPRGAQLVGILRADGPDTPHEDELMVITGWGARAGDANDAPFAMLINGRSWPYTKRLHYAVADTARWVVVNTTDAAHPMHLHGFHFLVTARGDGVRDTTYTPDRRRLAVTETILEGQTMALEWVPERGGRWMFHCHFTAHMDGGMHDAIAGREPGDAHAAHDDPEAHARSAMAGLVIGIEVEGDPALGLVRSMAARTERLVVQSRASAFGEEPGYAYVLQRGGVPAPDSIEIPGSRIDARVGEPIEINIVNHLDQRTAVHWHGLEIESYYDGVPGWTGDANRTTPFIEPGDSFVVRIVPVRAGTYMYHSHFDDAAQLGRGLFAPFIVSAAGDAPDPATDHTIVFSMAGTSDDSPVVANNGRSPAVVLAAGRENRIRFINITADDVVYFALLDGGAPGNWRVLANDGADLPPALTGTIDARMALGAGETADVLVVPRHDLRLDVKSFNDFVVPIAVR